MSARMIAERRNSVVSRFIVDGLALVLVVDGDGGDGGDGGEGGERREGGREV